MAHMLLDNENKLIYAIYFICYNYIEIKINTENFIKISQTIRTRNNFFSSNGFANIKQ